MRKKRPLKDPTSQSLSRKSFPYFIVFFQPVLSFETWCEKMGEREKDVIHEKKSLSVSCSPAQDSPPDLESQFRF